VETRLGLTLYPNLGAEESSHIWRSEMNKREYNVAIKGLTKEVLKDPEVKEALNKCLEEADKKIRKVIEKKQAEVISKFDSTECNHKKMSWAISRDIILRRLHLYGKCEECFQYGEEVLCKDNWFLERSLLWAYTHSLFTLGKEGGNDIYDHSKHA
jgi:hypothetical protein